MTSAYWPKTRLGAVALVSGNGSFLSLIKFSSSLVNCSVIRHMLNVVSASDLVAVDVVSAEMTLQMQFLAFLIHSLSDLLLERFKSL